MIACILLEMTLKTITPPGVAGGPDDVLQIADESGACLIHALLLNNDPAALRDFSKASTKERAMLLRTINMQINRTNQVRIQHLLYPVLQPEH